MYVIVRGDLPIGLQMAQVCHASVEYALRYPEKARSTPIGVVLNVPNEDALLEYADRVHYSDVPYVVFTEEDLGGENTALAVVTDDRCFSDLPLAGLRHTPWKGFAHDMSGESDMSQYDHGRGGVKPASTSMAEIRLPRRSGGS